MADNQERPLVTFALFAYNQERFIREAVEGALAQTYSPLQIILSDDCSSDRTFEYMKEMARSYEGPHQIVLNRNESNQGIGGHINRVMRLVKGDLIIVAAGDDISMPQRTGTVVNVWLKAGRKADLLCSDYVAISEDGNNLEVKQGCIIESLTAEMMARYEYGIIGATAAWTSRLWQKAGELPQGTVNEDVVLSFRAVLCGGIEYINRPLLYYREGVSMWIARGAAGHVEIQRRNGVLAKNSFKNAQTAMDDALKLERRDLLPLLKIRVAGSNLLHRLHNSQIPHLNEIIHVIFSGGRIGLILRAYLRRKLPITHAFVHMSRRLYFRQ
ncbi:MAG: glycosyltransferase [Candidatus Competibacteraceae bacterium]